MSVISKADRGRLARLITRLQDSPAEADAAIAEDGTGTGSAAAHIVGISGVGGAGKSTLIARMLPILRDEDLRVVVLAIDPTSDMSQGALLGDRIRMRDSYVDEGVFIRSLATPRCVRSADRRPSGHHSRLLRLGRCSHRRDRRRRTG